MAMRNSDATFLRREVLPILERASVLSPEAAEARDRLAERLAAERPTEDPIVQFNRWYRTMPEDHDARLDDNEKVWQVTLVVNDHEVPYIRGTLHEGGPHDGHVSLTLDRRFGFDTDVDEVRRWGSFLADAMAVSAGRTSHGEHSYIRNPHGRSGGGDPPPLLGITSEDE